MTARAGMADLITHVRRLASAGTADYTVSGTTYWTDDQVQALLDRTRVTHKTVPVYPLTEFEDSTYETTEYPFPAGIHHVEQAGTVTSGWALRDSVGGTVGSYSVNYDARLITFEADTDDETYYLDCRTYDPFAAAAEVWEEKAALTAGDVDWKTDNHDIKASQAYQHCMTMAQKLRERSLTRGGIQTTLFVRSDET